MFISGSKIEITPEMIEAEVDAVSRIHWEMDRFEEMAVSIYEAMVRAERLRKSAARSRGAYTEMSIALRYNPSLQA